LRQRVIVNTGFQINCVDAQYRHNKFNQSYNTPTQINDIVVNVGDKF